MALEEGTYRIRFVPTSVLPPFEGGLYATATGVGEPILAEAEGPDNAPVVSATITPYLEFTLTDIDLVGGSPQSPDWKVYHNPARLQEQEPFVRSWTCPHGMESRQSFRELPRREYPVQGRLCRTRYSACWRGEKRYL